MRSLGVKPYIHDGEIWPQETIYISLLCGAKQILTS